jgi:hypothetical protein
MFLGGYIATRVVGSLNDPASAAAGGLLAGALIGGGQWLALRSRGMTRRRVGYTAVAMAAGSALGATITGAGTELTDVMLWGAVTGAAVGAVQSALLTRRPRVSAAWTAVTALSWSLGWLVTSQGHRRHRARPPRVRLERRGARDRPPGLVLRQLLASAPPATTLSV